MTFLTDDGFRRLSQLPPIKRARDYYLYGIDGKRYLDLYQDAGNGLLGARPAGYGLSLKQRLEPGLYHPYPSVEQARLIKAIQAIFPHCKSYIFVPSLQDALSITQKKESRASYYCTEKDLPSDILLQWYPCTFRPQGVWLAQFPLPGFPPYYLLCSEDSTAFEAYTPALFSPLLFAALCKIIYTLKTWVDGVDKRVWKVPLVSELWSGKEFTPYLLPRCTEQEYDKWFSFFLERQILISPEYHLPSIAPSCLSHGGAKQFKS